MLVTISFYSVTQMIGMISRSVTARWVSGNLKGGFSFGASSKGLLHVRVSSVACDHDHDFGSNRLRVGMLF